uniref:F-box associated domain-containing protein n=1 Tax=Panagrellus redivivus TaxID=6233 RepID=A0A7E4V3G1_PANRE
MPFPFYALHYDHCYRLRKLATPGELYELQLAAPFLAGLKPIQKLDIFDAINVFINHKNEFEAKFFDPNELCASKTTLELNNNNFNICNDWLYITSFSSHDSAQRIFDYFSITDCKMFRFKNCGITAQFLEDIKRKTKYVERLSFVNCTFENNITPNFICATFKTLKMLKFDRGCPAEGNWIEAFVAAKYSGIQLSRLSRIFVFRWPCFRHDNNALLMLRHCGQRRDCRQPHIRLPRPDPLRHTPPAALLLPRLAGAPSTASKRTWKRFFQMQSQTMQMCFVLTIDADKFTVMKILHYWFYDGWQRLTGPKQKINVYHYNGTILRPQI